MALGKRQLTLRSCQDRGSTKWLWYFYMFYKIMNALVDHFLTKLSKYLWIKTGDGHYHFVEPWVIDRPFCRMETVYRSHFIEKGVGSLQNGAHQPHPGNGNRDIYVYMYICIYVVEPPFGLRLLLPFWYRRGGVLVHGWCAEKENRGKGGSGKGKIGAGVGSCRSMDPVRIPSGPSRAPIFAFLGTAFGQSGSSRDPVGHQCQPNS